MAWNEIPDPMLLIPIHPTRGRNEMQNSAGIIIFFQAERKVLCSNRPPSTTAAPPPPPIEITEAL